MSLLQLRKIFLAVLLASFMALGMGACSSSGDSDDAAADESAPAPADTASGEVPPDEGFDCSVYENQAARDNCEDAKGIIN